jgi:predicted RND superfamily exporter protein
VAGLDRFLTIPARRPRTTLVALVALAVAGGLGVAWRGVRLDFGVEQFVPQDDPLFERYQALNERFGRDDNTAFVFASGPQWFSADGLRLADELSRALADSELVDEVLGPATATLIEDEGEQVYVGPVLTAQRLASFDEAARLRLRDHLTREPVYAGRVVAADARTLAFAVRVAPEFYGGRFHRRVVQHVDGVLEAFAPRGVEFLVSGGPPTQDAYQRFLLEDARLFVLATCLILGLALFVTFRSLQGVVLPLLGVGSALYFTFVFLAVGGFPVNMLSSAIPVLVLIVGISDAIHLLTRYAEEMLACGEKQPALERALVATAHACLMTSITTSVGFFVLPGTGIPMLSDMGVVTGFGVVAAYLTSMTIIPALASLLPAPKRLPSASAGTRLHRLGDWVMDRPWRVTLGVLGAVGVAVALGAPRLRVESRVVDDLPLDHPVVRERDAIEQRMGGNYPLTLLVHPTPPLEDPSGDVDLLERVAAFMQALAKEEGQRPAPYLSGSLALTDYLGLGWRELGGEGLPPTAEAVAQVRLFLGEEVFEQTVDPVDGALRLQLRVYDRGTQATFSFLERARAAFQRTVGDRARLEVQGFTYLAHRTHRAIVWSSMTSFTLDFAIVAVLVCLLFRSLRLTVLAIIPNLFPLICTVAFMGLAGIDLRISSAIVFSIVFGIAVDDTVHFLARFHEERSGGLGPRAATRKTIATTGRAMLFMSFVLAAGFSVLLLSAFAPNQTLGLLMAVTVASGLVGDLVLLPALLTLGTREPSA